MSGDGRKFRLFEALLGCFWAVLILFCLLHRDQFSIERILSASPASPFGAALLLLVLFALKSLSIFLYSGLLYTVSGLLFPLPWAIALNLAGTGIMVSLPYLLGRRLGARTVQTARERWPRVEQLLSLRGGSDFLFVLSVRLFGMLPIDVVSAVCGAMGVGYGGYLAGGLLGLLPSCILFPIMGTHLSDPTSPQFRLAALIEAGCFLISFLVFLLYRRKTKK
mgnify:FL=1